MPLSTTQTRRGHIGSSRTSLGVEVLGFCRDYVSIGQQQFQPFDSHLISAIIYDRKPMTGTPEKATNEDHSPSRAMDGDDVDHVTLSEVD